LLKQPGNKPPRDHRAAPIHQTAPERCRNAWFIGYSRRAVSRAHTIGSTGVAASSEMFFNGAKEG
jgi:hypothetical protein